MCLVSRANEVLSSATNIRRAFTVLPWTCLHICVQVNSDDPASIYTVVNIGGDDEFYSAYEEASSTYGSIAPFSIIPFTATTSTSI